MSSTDGKPSTEERVKALKEKLKQGLTMKTGEEWKAQLKRFSSVGPRSPLRYSFRNQVLLFVQAEERAALGQELDLSQVATFQGWKGLGRMVRKGETALWILKPSICKDKKRMQKLIEDKGRKLTADEEKECSFTLYGLMPVFAVSQTDGEALEVPTVPDLATSAGWDGACHALTSVALADGVPAVNFRARRLLDSPRALGWCNLMTREITVITDGQTRDAQFSTAVHELAHAMLHCGSGHNPHEYAHNEIEAESISFIVCGAMNLDTSGFSFGYVAGWAKGEDPVKQVDESGRRIVATACKILDALADVERATGIAEAA